MADVRTEHGTCPRCNRGDSSEGQVLKRVLRRGKRCDHCIPFKTDTGKDVRLAPASEVNDVSAEEITRRHFGLDVR